MQVAETRIGKSLWKICGTFFYQQFLPSKGEAMSKKNTAVASLRICKLDSD